MDALLLYVYIGLPGVGFLVGELVGFRVGASVGFGVGLLVGESVGFGVGALVGLWVGFGVGASVGLGVGLLVGDSVVASFWSISSLILLHSALSVSRLAEECPNCTQGGGEWC